MSAPTTVVFADIAGSTALFDTLGNEQAALVVTRFTQWITDNITSYGGRVVKTLGDGVLAVFADASAAVGASAEVLRFHHQHLSRLPASQQVHLRIGVASGEVLEVDEDTYGDAVNVAARLCDRAAPGEIWATEATVNLAGGIEGIWFRKLGMVEIRGKVEPMRLFQVKWHAEEEHTSHTTTYAGLMSDFSQLDTPVRSIDLIWQGSQYRFASDEAPIQIGRISNSHLVISDPRVSRTHARIDWRNDTFVLTDTSTYGTWVCFDGSDQQIRLRRDACLLTGAGHISMGVPFGNDAPTLTFEVIGAS